MRQMLGRSPRSSRAVDTTTKTRNVILACTSATVHNGFLAPAWPSEWEAIAVHWQRIVGREEVWPHMIVTEREVAEEGKVCTRLQVNSAFGDMARSKVYYVRR